MTHLNKPLPPLTISILSLLPSLFQTLTHSHYFSRVQSTHYLFKSHFLFLSLFFFSLPPLPLLPFRVSSSYNTSVISPLSSQDPSAHMLVNQVLLLQVLYRVGVGLYATLDTFALVLLSKYYSLLSMSAILEAQLDSSTQMPMGKKMPARYHSYSEYERCLHLSISSIH